MDMESSITSLTSLTNVTSTVSGSSVWSDSGTDLNNSDLGSINSDGTIDVNDSTFEDMLDTVVLVNADEGGKDFKPHDSSSSKFSSGSKHEEIMKQTFSENQMSLPNGFTVPNVKSPETLSTCSTTSLLNMTVEPDDDSGSEVSSLYLNGLVGQNSKSVPEMKPNTSVVQRFAELDKEFNALIMDATVNFCQMQQGMGRQPGEENGQMQKGMEWNDKAHLEQDLGKEKHLQQNEEEVKKSPKQRSRKMSDFRHGGLNLMDMNNEDHQNISDPPFHSKTSLKIGIEQQGGRSNMRNSYPKYPPLGKCSTNGDDILKAVMNGEQELSFNPNLGNRYVKSGMVLEAFSDIASEMLDGDWEDALSSVSDQNCVELGRSNEHKITEVSHNRNIVKPEYSKEQVSLCSHNSQERKISADSGVDVTDCDKAPMDVVNNVEKTGDVMTPKNAGDIMASSREPGDIVTDSWKSNVEPTISNGINRTSIKQAECTVSYNRHPEDILAYVSHVGDVMSDMKETKSISDVPIVISEQECSVGKQSKQKKRKSSSRKMRNKLDTIIDRITELQVQSTQSRVDWLAVSMKDHTKDLNLDNAQAIETSSAKLEENVDHETKATTDQVVHDVDMDLQNSDKELPGQCDPHAISVTMTAAENAGGEDKSDPECESKQDVCTVPCKASSDDTKTLDRDSNTEMQVLQGACDVDENMSGKETSILDKTVESHSDTQTVPEVTSIESEMHSNPSVKIKIDMPDRVSCDKSEQTESHSVTNTRAIETENPIECDVHECQSDKSSSDKERTPNPDSIAIVPEPQMNQDTCCIDHMLIKASGDRDRDDKDYQKAGMLIKKGAYDIDEDVADVTPSSVEGLLTSSLRKDAEAISSSKDLEKSCETESGDSKCTNSQILEQTSAKGANRPDNDEASVPESDDYKRTEMKKSGDTLNRRSEYHDSPSLADKSANSNHPALKTPKRKIRNKVKQHQRPDIRGQSEDSVDATSYISSETDGSGSFTYQTKCNEPKSQKRTLEKLKRPIAIPTQELNVAGVHQLDCLFYPPVSKGLSENCYVQLQQLVQATFHTGIFINTEIGR